MKKIIIAVVLVLLVAAFSFADTYTVKSFTGSVTRAGGGAIRVNDILAGDIIINIGLGASIVLADAAGNEVTLRRTGTGSGTVADLFIAAAGTRISGTVTSTDSAAAVRTTTQTGTASARASDQAGEDDIAAE